MIERDCSINFEVAIVIILIRNWLTIKTSIVEQLFGAGGRNLRKTVSV